MGGPGRYDAEGMIGHKAASPFLGHANRAWVLLPQLGDSLGRNQVGS